MKNLTTLAFVALATLASAQRSEPMKPEQIAKQQTEMLTSTLKLNDEEVAKLNELMIEAAMSTSSLREECRAIDEKINANYDERVSGFVSSLSQEQQDMYTAARKEGKIDYSSCGAGGCAAGAGQASGCGSTGKTSGSSKAIGSGKSCCASGASHGEAKPADSGKEAPAKK